MNYDFVDQNIENWVIRHALILQGKQNNKRAVYISSQSGECYQIWVGLPSNGQIMVSVVCIEGPRDEDLEREWLVDVENVGDGLEEAYRIVIDWMAPSERLWPAGRPHAT